MARRRRTSKVLDKAQQRAANLASISPTLDLGNNLTLVACKATIADTQAKTETYTSALAAVDAAYNALLAAENDLAALSERMLLGVATKYGLDSSEYEMAGGTRRSERKRRARQPQP